MLFLLCGVEHSKNKFSIKEKENPLTRSIENFKQYCPQTKYLL